MVRKKTLPSGIRLYHGMTPDNVQAFKLQNAQEILGQLIDSSQKEQNAHWGNSLYLSYDISVPLAYINQNGDIGFIVELETVEDLEYIRSCDEIFASGQCGSFVPKNIKNEVKCFLEEEQGEQMFMTYLGKNGYAFECFHDLKHRVELIVPCNLINKFKVTSITPVHYSKEIENFVVESLISKTI